MRHLYFPILAGGCMFVSALHAQNERPNIVFIMADDLGWNDLGITGSDYYETPNIDKLASEGVSLIMLMQRQPIRHRAVPVL